MTSSGASPTSPPPARPLAAENIDKRFGAIQALRGVSLTVGADELVVVVGPTGAGKTTLLRVLCGLEVPDSGRVLLSGRDGTAAPTAERNLAMVFQNFSLYPRWSVRKNLEFPLMAPGRELPEAQRARRIGWAAEMLGLTSLLSRPASQLSGGEMQRVAIGRAIVREPRAYLMDEPLTNLDAKLREALRGELVELRRRVARPMIYVTHDPAEALAMGDRVVVLADGRVLQTGTPQAVYTEPRTPTVALQLGQPKVNVLPVERHAGNWLVVAEAEAKTTAEPSRAQSAGVALAGDSPACVLPAGPVPGSRALLGIRPEHLEVRVESDAEADAAHVDVGAGPWNSARIHLVEYMGAATTLLLSWLGREVRASVEGATGFEPGQPVRVRVRRALLWPAGSR